MHTGIRMIQLLLSMLVNPVARSKRNYSLAAIALLLAALGCVAQESTAPASSPQPAAQDRPQQTAPRANPTVVVPEGSRIPLVLQRSISTKTTRTGDMAYLLTTAPVTVGDRMVIPPGTFVQGPIASIVIPGIDRDGELEIHFARMVFPNGYTVSMPYDLVVPLDRRWIYPEAPSGGKAAAFAAAFAAPVVGALIGGLASRHSPPPLTLPVPGQPLTLPNLGNPVKGAAIGAAIGMGVTIPVTVALLRHHHDFFVEEGVPAELILPGPLELAEDRIADDATRPSGQVLAAELPQTPPARRTCYTPDTPGTPDTVIPGSPAIPGTASVGDMSGTPDIPGTPDTIIPGSPAIPGTPYPCR
jgi:hypothetical protein